MPGRAGIGAILARRACAQSWTRAGIPTEAVGLYVQEVGAATPLLAWNAEKPMNPASAMKLLTTLAALEVLGPAYTWRTEVYADGLLRGDVLEGDLVLKGSGDPKLDLEKFWLLVKTLRGRGLREIRGDLVADRSAFALENSDPARFDNAPTRPYNVQPDALLVNYKSIDLQFIPQEDSGTVRIVSLPELAQISIINQLALGAGNCEFWPERPMASVDDAAARVHRPVPARLRREAQELQPAHARRLPAGAVPTALAGGGRNVRGPGARGAGARHPRVCSPPGSRLRWRRSSATSTSGATT